MEDLILSDGEQSLLKGDLERSRWALDTLAALDPSRAPKLWQRGLCYYYSGQYEDGMRQFEADMSINGGDVEEVLWHFICKCGKYGFQKAFSDGFLLLIATGQSPPPMDKVLLMYKGQATPTDVIELATGDGNSIVLSYNDSNALAYAHFYIGIYHQLLGNHDKAGYHFKEACQYNIVDYMGQIMEFHYKLHQRKATGIRLMMPTFNIGRSRECPRLIFGCWQLSAGHGRSNMC